MPRVWQLRAAVLTLVGVLVVHYGRFMFAPPAHEHALSSTHRYLTWLAPLAAVLVLLAVLQLAVHAARVRNDAPQLPPDGVLWLALTMTLLTAFGAQESVELYLLHGHLPGLAELLGAGGWTAIPFAIAAAGGIALLLRGAAHVVRWAASRRRTRPRLAATAVLAPRPPVIAAPRSVLARRLAGRGPPLSA